MTAADFISAAVSLITDFGVMPVILATAIVSVAALLFRRIRAAAR